MADLRGPEVQLFRELLGLDVQDVHVVLPGVEVVPDLFVWHGEGLWSGGPAEDLTARGDGQHRLALQAFLRGQGELVRDVPVAAVHVHHGAGDRGVVAHQLGQFGDVHRGGPDIAVGHDVLNLGEQAEGVLVGEEGGVHAEGLGDLLQHRQGQGALIVLDLVDVARGQSQGRGELGLRDIPLLAQLPQPGTHEVPVRLVRRAGALGSSGTLGAPDTPGAGGRCVCHAEPFFVAEALCGGAFPGQVPAEYLARGWCCLFHG